MPETARPVPVARVIESLGQGLGFAQQREDTPRVAQWRERHTQSEPEINRLLARVARLRQMWQGIERLLEVPHSLAVGRSHHGFLPCLSAVRQGLIPHLAAQGMLRQPLHLVVPPIPR